MTSITILKLGSCGALLLLVLASPGRSALAQESETPTTPPVTTPTTSTPLATTPTATTSTTRPAAAPQHHASPHYKRSNLDDRVAVLAKNLDLNETQRSALKRILEQRQLQTLRIRDSAMPGSVRVDQFRALQDNTVAQIRGILTDEQKKKYDPLISRKIPAASTPQRSLEDWIKATTPH